MTSRDTWGSLSAARIEEEEREHARHHICTPDDPWRPGTGRRLHPSAREVPGSQRDGLPHGGTIAMHCPVCGLTWRVELPK